MCFGFTVPVFAQAEVEPIRCWWQTSAGAITIGQTFDVTLTCAVLDTESVQVVPDESRLNIASVQLTPFEIVGGDHPADSRTTTRRFLQYRYSIRTLDRDLIGHDINIQQMPISYRVHSKVGADASLEGRDLTYLLPAMPLKVLSLVPREATDIRDAGQANLSTVESLRFRSNAFQLLALTLGLVSLVLAAWGVGPLLRTRQASTEEAPGRLPGKLIVFRAIAELTDVQSAASSGGWNDALTPRGLAALRIIAACAIGRPVSQRVLTKGGPVPEGRLLVERGWPHLRALRFGGQARALQVTVSSPTTADHVTQAMAVAASETERLELEGLRDGLKAFTAAVYPKSPVHDSLPLDDATRHALSVARQLPRK
jgi:hypothetical protein